MEVLKISTFIYLARIFRGGTVHLAEAQDFTPVSSCSSGLSTFAGIVCSGNNVDGKVIHCIFDENFQLGLVCTQWQQTLPGRCPRYLEEFKEVGAFPCTGGECPDVFFPSHEAYKYPACLNRSLYITEPTTTQADTKEQSISCRDCVDGGSTGSTTGTDTTTKSTVPTDSECDIISETSKQPMSCAVCVAVAVPCIVLVTLLCLLMVPVLEYYTRKSALEVIRGFLKKGTCNHSTTENVQVSNEETEPSAESHFMATPPSRVVAEQSQQV